MSKKKMFLTTLIGLMVVGAIFLVISKGRQPADLSNALAADMVMEPTQFDSAGVDTTSQFIVSASTQIDPKMLEENISVNPTIDFVVEEKKGSGEILIIPQESLKADELYQFTIDVKDAKPLKWAFQTKGEFKINGSLPRNQSTGVPINTGIEIAFSHNNFETIDKYFEISPKTKGHFEKHQKTAVFVPDSLDPGTIYLVKVKKGLKLTESDVALEEDFTFQFETQDPAQHDQNKEHFDFFANNMEIGSSALPVIPVAYYKMDDDTAPMAEVAFYQYQDSEAYIKSIQEREEIPFWAFFSRSQYLTETKNLKTAGNFSTKLKSYNGEDYLEFPEILAPGYYLCEAKIGSAVRQIWLQVSDLVVYTSVGENKTLVWVNNLVDGKPAVQAKVTFPNGQEVDTDEKGVAEVDGLKIDNTDNTGNAGVYLKVKLNNQEIVAAVSPSLYRPMMEERERSQIQSDYWSYLYLDRGLYKTADTVRFWGLIKGREKNTDLGQVTVALTKWQSGLNQEVVLEEKQVEVEANIFTGEIKLPNLIPGYYNLTVKKDDLILMQQGFDVETYTKPAYRIDVVPEKNAIFVGDTMDFNISTTGFEGTPVPKVKLEYNLDQSGQLITDGEGKAKHAYTPKYQSDNYGAVQNRYFYLYANLPESGEISTGLSVIVLNNDIDIRAKGEIKDLKGKINIEVDKLAVDKVNKGAIDPWEEDAFVSGKEAGLPVNLAIFRQEWDKFEDGEYYDFINKEVVKNYRYEERKVLVKETQVITDVKGKAGYDFEAEDKKSYFVQITAVDGKKNQAQTELYLAGGYYPQQYVYSWYYLDDQESGAKKYAEGAEVLLNLKNNESDVADRKEGFLYYTAKRGIMDYQVQDTGAFKAIFSRDSIPNFWVKGVYFDGKGYHEITDYLAAFDEQEKALKIKISTDKEVYRPQDKVEVKVEVRDLEGRPVAATINLNLVDEALFMLSPQQVDLLRSLYGNFLASGILMTDATHDNPINYYGGGAEQGGEGGAERRDFKDTAYFETITTGKDGNASVSFQVPDNLTAWRLTYQAVTKDLLAGSGSAEIKVKLPFFVEMVINENYLAGDQPIVNLRSLGTDLNEDKEISYQVEVMEREKTSTEGKEGKEGKEAKKIFDEKLTGKAFMFTPVSLPVLEEGDYQITVTAIEGKTKDILTRSFQVVGSYMTEERVDYTLLDETSKLKADSNKPVTLTFADANWSQYLSNLLSLAYVDGNRVEQKLAPQVAQELLKKNYADFANLPLAPNQELSSYQTEDGGIAILPYGSSDLEVSAKIAPWAKEHFDLKSLSSYFEKVINNPKQTRERAIIALYGLASLGEPVLNEVELVSKEKDLTLLEQLYLVLAFSELGNEQPAVKLLKGILKTYGETNGAYMQINPGSVKADQHDTAKITVLAALAAEKLELSEANLLHRYTMENLPQDELNYLEQIAFLESGLEKTIPGKVEFSYTLGGKAGKKSNVELKPGETYSLVLAPGTLEVLSFENIKGEIGVTSQYQGIPTQSGEHYLEGVTLSRDYQVGGKSTHEFKTGDLVVVKVSWNAEDKTNKADKVTKASWGNYRITDYLPSGLKLVEKPFNFDVARPDFGWPVEVDGQKVVFLVSEKGTFNYYARIINQGSFTGENMTLQHVQSGKIYGMTALDKVDIK